MAGRPNGFVISDCNVIDAHLYRHLVTGNVQGFIAAVQRKPVGELKYPKDNNNVLHIAASFGHVDIVDIILKQWPQLFVLANSKADLALHSAIKAGKTNTVAHFIKWLHQWDNISETTKLVLGWKNSDGNTALHIALENDEQEIAQHLVDLYPPVLYVMNLNEICPLYMAIKLEMKDLVECMLRKLQLFKEDANRCLRKGKSVIHTVISAKKIEMLQYMLKYNPVLMNSMDNEGKTALSYAVYMGDLEKARLLLKLNPDSAFIYDGDGTYPIHQAIIGGYTNVMKLLSSSKFLLNAKGQNIIHIATLTGRTNLVFCLLNTMLEVDSLINQRDDDGNTPLHLATLAKNVGTVELLLQDIRVKVEVLNKEGLTAFDLAKKLILDNKDIRAVQRLNALLERDKSYLMCASIDGDLLRFLYQGEINQFFQVLSERRIQLKDLGCLEDGNNILHIAASMDIYSLNLVIDLLQHQFYLFMDQENNLGDLPIHSAIQAGKLENLKALFERRILPEKFADNICAWSNMKGNTPLHIALLTNQWEIATYLYKKCPKAAYYLNKENICPLFLAIRYWSKSDLVYEMINELDVNAIQNHMKNAKSVIHAIIGSKKTVILESIVGKTPLLLNSHDCNGRSPLSYAAHIGHVEGVRFLLGRFPDLEFQRDKGGDGSFPIHQAMKGGQLEILKLLHPENCLVNSKRQNILHIAAEAGRMDVIRYLLKMKEFKELVNVGDEDGNTPLHLAVKGSNSRAVYLLTLEKYIDSIALNNELLTANDMFRNLHDQKSLPFVEKIFLHLTLKRVEGQRSYLSKNRGTKRNEEKVREAEQVYAKDKAGVVSNTKQRRLTDMERVNVLLVAAVLIATTTFTATFTPPGGYNQVTGDPILLETTNFKIFNDSTFIAFCLALISVLSLIRATIQSTFSPVSQIFGGFCIVLGLLTMLLTFVTGIFGNNQRPSKENIEDLIVKLALFAFSTVPFVAVCYLISVNNSNFKRLKEVYVRLLLWIFLPEKKPRLDFTI